MIQLDATSSAMLKGSSRDDAGKSLRHMMAVGEKGRFAGNTIELFQFSTEQVSGGNYQDYYSNHLSYQFYEKYGEALKAIPIKFVNYLVSFLQDESVSRITYNGDELYYTEVKQ